MSNSTTLLDTLTSNQASKEVTANALFDAGSPSTLPGPARAIASRTRPSALILAECPAIVASMKLREMESAVRKARVSASGSGSSKAGFSVSRRAGRVSPANTPALEGLIAPLSIRSTGNTKDRSKAA